MCNEQKAQLRRIIKQKLKFISISDIARQSAEICRTILNSNVYIHAPQVFAYVPMSGEADISAVLADVLRTGKKLALPRCFGGAISYFYTDTLDLTQYDEEGIPVASIAIGEAISAHGTLILIPGIAFDESGGRLGRGKGYYDRYLQTVHKQSICAGVALSAQIVQNVPCNKHDARMMYVFKPFDGGRCR